MDTPITQSREWQKLQDDLGEENYFQEAKDYQYLAILKHTPVGNYLYCPCGPVAENRSAFQKALKSLVELAEKKSAAFIRIEPRTPESGQILRNTAILNTTGIHQIVKSKDLNPADTYILDLSQPAKDIMPSRLVRYHKNAAKNGLTIEKSHNPDDIHYLLDLQKVLAKQKGINTYSEHYLQTELKQPFATLYLLKKQKTVLAAGLVFDDETTRYNLQGAQSEEGRKEHATGILTIQLILDAYEQKKQYFDFWGIAPDGAPENHPWAGFTAFKKTFQGREEHYPGTHDLVLKPFRYKLYQLARKLKH